MTRFSRVTFNAAHNYLGLTTEVLRAEKAINDIACHPLPPSFYDGGLKSLRQRFDGVPLSSDSDTESDYFSHPPSLQSSSASSTRTFPDPFQGAQRSQQNSPVVSYKNLPSHQQVHAGDLHLAAGQTNDLHRQLPRRMSTLFGTSFPKRDSSSDQHADAPTGRILSTEEFDLRDEVMSCIAKSIGLIQPPMSGADSIEASPAFPPSESSRPRPGPFRSSFGPLSMLDAADDTSSMTGSVSSFTMAGGYMSGLDNEVEILFFSAGSVLAEAGERNTGLFYVIEGFLDIVLPQRDGAASDNQSSKGKQPRSEFGKKTSENGSRTRPAASSRETFTATPPDHDRKPLFTVKAGGIAGYLCTFVACSRRLPHSVLTSS